MLFGLKYNQTTKKTDPGSICYYFQKHLVQDNKATLTASKLRCGSSQEALEGSMFVCIEVQLSECM